MCNARTSSTCRERHPLTSFYWCGACYAAFLLEEQEAARRHHSIPEATDREWMAFLLEEREAARKYGGIAQEAALGECLDDLGAATQRGHRA